MTFETALHLVAHDRIKVWSTGDNPDAHRFIYGITKESMNELISTAPTMAKICDPVRKNVVRLRGAEFIRI